MKVFISMGMKSKSTEQVRQEMRKVFEYIKEKLPEAELIDSVIEGADSVIASSGEDIAIWYLSRSIEMLSKADLVFFVKGYDQYRGCNIERLISYKYGKFCIDLDI